MIGANSSSFHVAFLMALALVAVIPAVNLLTSRRSLTSQSLEESASVNLLIKDDNNSTALLLRDVHIVMIGDSLMRYQYLSLAYRLRYGYWFDDSKWYYHLVNENTFRDPFHKNTWGEFMFHTNRILQPNEVCDCRRVSKENSAWPATVLENRYFYDPVLNNSLVFLNAMGHCRPLRGRMYSHEIARHHRDRRRQQQVTAVGQEKDKLITALTNFTGISWEYHDWADLIRHQVQHLDPQPRQVVMNAGLWPHKFGWSKQNETSSSSSFVVGQLSPETKSLLHVMKEFPQYQYTWKTTTYSKERKNNNLVSDQVMCDLVSTCMNVSFTRQVRPNLFWDKIHFLEPVYRVANEEMLGLLGYLPDDYQRLNISDIF